MTFNIPALDDWRCDEHNAPLMLTKGRATCSRTYASHDGVLGRWMDPADTELLWHKRDCAFWRAGNGLWLRNRMVPWSRWTEADRDHDAMWEDNGHRSNATKYWHLFVENDPPEYAVSRFKVEGPMYADAEAVLPNGERPVSLGIGRSVLARGDEHRPEWAWVEEYAAEPSGRLQRARIDLFHHERARSRSLANYMDLVDSEGHRGKKV